MGRADDEDGAAVEEGRPAAAPGRGGGAALLAWTRRGSGKRRPDPRGGERSPRGKREDRVSHPRVVGFQMAN